MKEMHEMKEIMKETMKEETVNATTPQQSVNVEEVLNALFSASGGVVRLVAGSEEEDFFRRVEDVDQRPEIRGRRWTRGSGPQRRTSSWSRR
jgi:hypothetical protein